MTETPADKPEAEAPRRRTIIRKATRVQPSDTTRPDREF